MPWLVRWGAERKEMGKGGSDCRWQAEIALGGEHTVMYSEQKYIIHMKHSVTSSYLSLTQSTESTMLIISQL